MQAMRQLSFKLPKDLVDKLKLRCSDTNGYYNYGSVSTVMRILVEKFINNEVQVKTESRKF